MFKLTRAVFSFNYSFQVLFLEISDLEPEMHKETKAATQLLESHPQDVPPQLLMALNKDGQSLARAYSACRDFAKTTLQGLQVQRDAQNVRNICYIFSLLFNSIAVSFKTLYDYFIFLQEAVSSQLKSLDEQIDKLLSWLKETEAQMQEETGVDGMSVAEITRKLQLCQVIMSSQAFTCIYICSYSDCIFFNLSSFFFSPLQHIQTSLAARSSEVSNVAFNIQVFISEHAQDLLPDQSRHLLGQLEQLQRVFHQAIGLSHARAEALSVQQTRENERMKKEQKEKEEKMEKERQTKRDREVCKQMNNCFCCHFKNKNIQFYCYNHSVEIKAKL